MAREALDKRHQLSQQSQQAFQKGDKERAHELSEQAKQLQSTADNYNRQAAEYVFRENNADSDSNEIDLHGLFVGEAEFILKQRIQAAQRSNQSELKVIVGKGLHSQNGIAKIKPAVEQLCEEAHLDHHIDPHNTGVLVIRMNNNANVPSHWGNNVSQPQQAYQPQYQQQQPHYQQQQQQQHYNQNYNQQQNNTQGGTNDIVGIILKLVCACINSK